MVVGKKIGLIAVGSVVATACAGLLVQRSAIRRQGIEMLRDTMRVTVQSAENARNAISRLRNAHVFDDARLQANIAGVADFRKLPLYQTVPIVAAWNSIGEVAAREGYVFRVAAHQPRNVRNLPDAEESRIIAQMASQRVEEYFAVDEKANQVLYARAIKLSSDCLVCHGDPSQSPSKDGKDLLGFRMEGWKDGDHHGIFLLRSNLGRVDATVRAGMLQTALWLVPLSLLIGIAVYVLVARISSLLLGLTGSVAVAAQEVSSAVNQMSKASQALSQGTFEQTASLQQTSASSDEIASLTRRNADAAHQAMGTMDAVQNAVREGNASLQDMVASMSSIHASNQRISKIIRVIDNVAFQTNILALNAAVEAARAGEAGAGFAVVADEVRALAQRSAQAARDTAPLIEESIVRVGEGVAKLERVTAVVQAITDLAATAKQTVGEVAATSQDQARGIQQMAQAVAQISSVTQSNAAMAEQSAASTEEIAAQVESLDEMARQLRQLVDESGVP